MPARGRSEQRIEYVTGGRPRPLTALIISSDEAPQLFPPRNAARRGADETRQAGPPPRRVAFASDRGEPTEATRREMGGSRAPRVLTNPSRAAREVGNGILSSGLPRHQKKNKGNGRARCAAPPKRHPIAHAKVRLVHKQLRRNVKCGGNSTVPKTAFVSWITPPARGVASFSFLVAFGKHFLVVAGQGRAAGDGARLFCAAPLPCPGRM